MTRINHQGASRGPPRLPPRITLLASNSKYKFKEERKRILKLSVKKLRSIEDPEAFLSRSVLINNTLKRLQSEVREEKAKKTTTTSSSNLISSCIISDMPTYNPSPYSFYSIEKAYREEMERSSTSGSGGSSSLDNNGNDSGMVTSSFPTSTTQGRSYDQHMFDADDEEEEDNADSQSSASNSTSGSGSDSSSSDEEEETTTAKDNTNNNTTVTSSTLSASNVEDDLLAEVYMPTPCSMPPMIASIDSEDDLHLRHPHHPHHASERPATPVPWTSTSGLPQNPSAEAVMKESSCDNEDIWSEAVRTECWTKPVDAQTSSMTTALRPSTVNTNVTWPSVDWPTYTPNSPTSSVTMSASSTVASSSSSTSAANSNQNSGFSPNISVPPCSSQHKENLFVHDKSLSDKCYSCGQSSLFQSELQSVVFNSLIASLET